MSAHKKFRSIPGEQFASIALMRERRTRHSGAVVALCWAQNVHEIPASYGPKDHEAKGVHEIPV